MLFDEAQKSRERWTLKILSFMISHILQVDSGSSVPRQVYLLFKLEVSYESLTNNTWEDKIQIKLLSGNKLIICDLWKLQYQIPRENFEPEPGIQLRTLRSIALRSNKIDIKTSTGNWTRMTQFLERQSRVLEVRGWNPGSGLKISHEIWNIWEDEFDYI